MWTNITRGTIRRKTTYTHYEGKKWLTRKHYENKRKHYEHKQKHRENTTQHYEYNTVLYKDNWCKHEHHYLLLHFLTMPTTTCRTCLRGCSLRV